MKIRQSETGGKKIRQSETGERKSANQKLGVKNQPVRKLGIKSAILETKQNAYPLIGSSEEQNPPMRNECQNRKALKLPDGKQAKKRSHSIFCTTFFPSAKNIHPPEALASQHCCSADQSNFCRDGSWRLIQFPIDEKGYRWEK
jgi:hypothetical protein